MDILNGQLFTLQAVQERDAKIDSDYTQALKDLAALIGTMVPSDKIHEVRDKCNKWIEERLLQIAEGSV